MADRMTPEALKTLLASKEQFAFIDVREAGEYNSSHIAGSSLMPRRHLEFQLPLAVPYKGTHVILCDDDGRRAPLAAKTVYIPSESISTSSTWATRSFRRDVR